MKKIILRCLLGLFILEVIGFQLLTINVMGKHADVINQNAKVLSEVIRFVTTIMPRGTGM